MKVLIEVVIISLLVVIGWRQPFQEHAARILPSKTAAELGIRARTPDHPAFPERDIRARPAPPPAPRDRSWMWQPQPLDAPEP